ncbi:outer membrane beta-barrel protein [Galbibacter sp.]|uniref:outer membrane beta-barrel protein n=1 Tax=Galbibacter sp. TaxID=2918471 RepID=UPI003A8F1DA2
MFKKFFFFATLLASMATFGQEVSFGAQAGYLNMNAKATYDGASVSEGNSGFYVGALADFTLSESFHVQPSLNYGNVDDTGFLIIPVMAQYHIQNSGFYLQAGPQATYALEDTPDEINGFGLDLALGAGYQINDNFFVEAKYAFEITNRLSGDAGNDVKYRINTLSVGLGYKF